MVRLGCFALVASLAAAAGPAFISSAFGNQVKLYEENSNGVLTFRLTSTSTVPVTFYAIETWANGTRYCSIREGAYLKAGSDLIIPEQCAVPVDLKTGRTVEHASRLVGVGFANGRQWRVPQSVPVLRH